MSFKLSCTWHHTINWLIAWRSLFLCVYMSFWTELWQFLIIMISIKIIIIPSILRDIFLIFLKILFRPKEMFGSIFRMCRKIPISKIENIPMPKISRWWLLTSIETLTTRIKMKETWWMIRYKYRVIWILNRIFETKIILKLNKINWCLYNFCVICMCISIFLLFK